jgi:hypothetical protein
MTFSLSRTTIEVSHVAAGEHMGPGQFHIYCITHLINFTIMILPTAHC